MLIPTFLMRAVLSIVAVAPASMAVAQCQPAFVPGPFTSINGEVNALAQFDDGRGGQVVYLGGQFTEVNGVSVNRIFRWWPHSGEWEPCDHTSGPVLQAVWDFEIYDDGSGPALYASTGGGVFRLNQAVAQATWEPIGSNPSLTSCGDLLASSTFGTNTLYGIALWNSAATVIAYRPESGWIRVGDPALTSISGFRGWSLAEDPAGHALFVVGRSYFRSTSGSLTDNHGAVRWDGMSWASPVVAEPFPNAPAFQTNTTCAINFDDGHGVRIFVCGDQPGSFSSLFTLTDGRWRRVGEPPATFPDTLTFAATVFDAGRGRRLVAENYGGLMEWDGQQWSTIIPTRTFRDNGGGVPTANRALEYTARPGVRPILVIAGGFPIPRSPYTKVLYITSCAPCPADFDHSGSVGVQDLLSYLQAWFPRDPAAEFDGTPGVDLEDLFAYLAAWHVGCL